MVLRELGPNLGGGDENFAMVHVRIRYFLVFFFGTCSGCGLDNNIYVFWKINLWNVKNDSDISGRPDLKFLPDAGHVRLSNFGRTPDAGHSLFYFKTPISEITAKNSTISLMLVSKLLPPNAVHL